MTPLAKSGWRGGSFSASWHWVGGLIGSVDTIGLVRSALEGGSVERGTPISTWLSPSVDSSHGCQTAARFESDSVTR